MTDTHESGRPTKRARLFYEQDSKKVFPWWKLPGELRNRIYELVLLEDSLLHFRQVNRCWKYTAQPAPNQETDTEVEDDELDIDPPNGLIAKHCFKRQKPERLDTSILYVDSRMYTEAASMLYAQNVFCFQTAGVLHRFIAKLSPRARIWIRHIKIVDWTTPCLKRQKAVATAFRSLSSCTNLRRVELVRATTFDGSLSLAKLARILLGLPACHKWLKQIGEMRNDPRAGAEVLCFGDNLLRFDTTGRHMAEYIIDEETSGPRKRLRDDPNEGGSESSAQELKRVLGDLLVSLKFCAS